MGWPGNLQIVPPGCRKHSRNCRVRTIALAGVLGSEVVLPLVPEKISVATDRGGCPPALSLSSQQLNFSHSSMILNVSGPEAEPFNITIILHPQTPSSLLDRLNSHQRPPLQLTLSVC